MVAPAQIGLKVATAARLADGRPVYLGDAGWIAEIAHATARPAESAEPLLEQAKGDARANIVIGPELIDVTVVDGRVVPLSLRERIRAEGPTVAAGSVPAR